MPTIFSPPRISTVIVPSRSMSDPELSRPWTGAAENEESSRPNHSMGHWLVKSWTLEIEGFPLSRMQAQVTAYLFDQLHWEALRNGLEFKFDYSIEEELVISYRSESGLHLLSVDTYGDLMVGYTGFDGETRVQHYDWEEMNEKSPLIIKGFLPA